MTGTISTILTNPMTDQLLRRLPSNELVLDKLASPERGGTIINIRINGILQVSFMKDKSLEKEIF